MRGIFMKKITNRFFCALVLFCIVGVFVGCQQEPKELTWTVYTDIGTYSEFETAFQTTLDDGYYAKAEFSSAGWDALKSSMSDEYKHQWTKSQIID